MSRRTREFGLRLALGATPRQILKLVVDYSVHIILIGLLPAVLLASLGTRLFEHQLSGLMPNGITMWVRGAADRSRRASWPDSCPRAAPRASIRMSRCGSCETSGVFDRPFR